MQWHAWLVHKTGDRVYNPKGICLVITRDIVPSTTVSTYSKIYS